MGAIPRPTIAYIGKSYIEEIALNIWDLTTEDGDALYPDHEAPMYLGYAVLALTKGTATTSRDVHDAWSAWAVVHHKGDHRSIVPFEQLTPEVQAYDDLYRDAIHTVAKSLDIERES